VANNPVINSFNSGELSPYLYARNDLSKYNSGCLLMENFQILPYGGATGRAAIEYIAASKQDDKVRLIPFEFSSEQAYILEFGEQYIRFYKDGEQLESGGSPYEIATEYAAADLGELKYVQSADVMWLVHPDYPVQRLERTGDTNWSLAEMEPDYPAFLEENTTDISITPSATTGTGITLTASDSLFDANHVGAYWMLKHVREDNYLEDLDASVVSGDPPEPDGTNVMEMKGTITFQTTGFWYNSNDPITNPGSNDIAVWRSDDGGDTWERFRIYNLKGRNVDTSWEEKKRDVLYAVTSSKTGTIDYSDKGNFKLSVASYYVEGLVKITGYTSDTVVTADVIDDIKTTDATKKWVEGAWSAYRGYPQAVVLWESRLIFAGTLSRPNTLWLSVIDDFQDFELGSLDTDAMKITIGSGRIDEIRWMVPQKALVIGTVGSEWVLEAESDNKPVTPTAFALRRKTTYGSNKTQGVMVNSAVLFVMRQGRKVREFTYRFDVDDYVAPDLTILSEHITEGGITCAAYQQQPDNVLLLIRNDGTMCPMTYERDQEVTGWYRWTVDGGAGEFESVAVIPQDDGEDEVWVSCKLTVDGSTKRYIGRFDPREWGTDIATEWSGSDFYTVFNALDMDGWQTLTVSGADESTFNGSWTYDSGDARWEKGALTLEKNTNWEMTDGTDTYSAQDNGKDVPPVVFIKNTESSDASVAALNGSVAWKKSGLFENGEAVLYDYTETYALWYNGEQWIISEKQYVGESPTDFYADYPDPITISGAGTSEYNGSYIYIGQKNGKGQWGQYDGLFYGPFIEWSGSEWQILSGNFILPDRRAYISSVDSLLPPISPTDWVVSTLGSAPSPTLSYTASTTLTGYGSWTGTITFSSAPFAFVNQSSTSLSGLDYLEGKTVDIIRDGMTLPQQEVSSGSITLDKLGERVVVGIPYDPAMAPIYVEPMVQFQQPMGKKKGLFKAVLRFKDTIHAKVGQSLDKLRTITFRTTGDELDTQVDMFSGEKKISFDNEYEFLHTCYVKQDKPLPITVVAMIPYVEVKR
jgi:hypothetical protein